jgi:Cu(I)/Ag(I) efflux system membrane fusion protein
MKKIVLIASVAAFIVFTASCNSGSGNAKNKSLEQSANTEVYYTCTMHPQVHLDKPGNCPICGMELVKKEIAKTENSQMQQNSDSTMQK